MGQYRCHVKFEYCLLRNKFTNATQDRHLCMYFTADFLDMYLKGERVVDSYSKKFALANVI